MMWFITYVIITAILIIIVIKKINIKKQVASILERVEDSFEIKGLPHLEKKDGYLRVNHHIYLLNRSLFEFSITIF